MAPVILPANQPDNRIFAGGARLAAFRSDPQCSSRLGEDWIASTTCCFGTAGIGYSRLPDGQLLHEAITADPEKWLGPDHLAKYGADTKLLVKLLDAGQRLPVHAHPHADWAKQHLGRNHGKAEAWYILTPGSVWLGLKETVQPDQLLSLVEAERGAELLDRMHKFDVVPHQTLYVPPGTLHAIGEGVMVVELQEPEDMSILCEWEGFDIDGKKDGHLGLGFPAALTGVDYRARTREQADLWVTRDLVSESVCSAESQEYFRLERVCVQGSADTAPGFAILIVLEGKISLQTSKSEPVSLAKGSTVVIAFEDGSIHLDGDADVLIARPPQ
ncbi:hypothetical protein QQS21_006675 [Conoideocrella luteorostrata]|uniref:Mannose-6-phosphate isomerase cupin domain-containing protein n=1 Tax=Conoideocrella luteorostrata TaxID=1105319 RepID=A0AAJ0CM74_9HYPO|nr:hypothetical protein QQS21_006675 [Conoideocrella luteorostrata]